MKNSFLNFFHILFLSFISVHVLFCPDLRESPDTQTGIAYQLLFEQRFPFVDKAVDPKDVSETMATMLMLNRFKDYCLKKNTALLNESFGKEKAKNKLEKTEKTAFKKIEKTINELIDKHIVDVINNQAKIFDKKEDKGFIGKVARTARGKVANMFSSKNIPLEKRKDFKFRHISPAYTDAAPGLLKNNLEYLYEELFGIIQTARTIADLFVLSIFLNEGETPKIETKIETIKNAQQTLANQLTTYISEINQETFETAQSLAFFAKQYQSDSRQIISTVSRFLSALEHTAFDRQPSVANITNQENIENLLTFTILPTSFIDIDITRTLQNNQTKINAQQREIANLKQQVQLLEQENNKLELKLETVPYLKKEKEIDRKEKVKKKEQNVPLIKNISRDENIKNKIETQITLVENAIKNANVMSLTSLDYMNEEIKQAKDLLKSITYGTLKLELTNKLKDLSTMLEKAINTKKETVAKKLPKKERTYSAEQDIRYKIEKVQNAIQQKKVTLEDYNPLYELITLSRSLLEQINYDSHLKQTLTLDINNTEIQLNQERERLQNLIKREPSSEKRFTFDNDQYYSNLVQSKINSIQNATKEADQTDLQRLKNLSINSHAEALSFLQLIKEENLKNSLRKSLDIEKDNLDKAIKVKEKSEPKKLFPIPEE